MITIKEEDVLFHFAEECQAIKYDADTFYTENLGGKNFKGVDFMVTISDQPLWIEVKDFRKKIQRNKLRFIADDEKLNTINKYHVKNMHKCCSFQDIQKYELELKPKEEPLIDNVAQKIKDTLSGLCLLKNYFQLKDFNKSPLYKYAINLNSDVEIKIILFLVWDKNLTRTYGDFARLANLLKQKIEAKLGFKKLKIRVVNQDTAKEWFIHNGMDFDVQ
jgi:hypothetical protein